MGGEAKVFQTRRGAAAGRARGRGRSRVEPARWRVPLSLVGSRGPLVSFLLLFICGSGHLLDPQLRPRKEGKGSSANAGGPGTFC